MKNILISLILLLYSNLTFTQILPLNTPSCTQGGLHVLIVGDISTTRGQTLDSFEEILESRVRNSPLFGFFLNPLRTNVFVESLQLDFDNFWNNVYFDFYENEELLSRFGDNQKTALELSRALFKTSGLSKGYDREDYQIDEIREFANKEVVRALNGSASLDVELQNQVSLVASKVTTLLTQITGTTNVGTENKVIVVSYGNSSIIVKKALDSIPLLPSYEENWSGRLAHFSLGSDQVSSAFNSKNMILRLPGSNIHRDDFNGATFHTIQNISDRTILSNNFISRWIVSTLGSIQLKIPYILNNDLDLLKRYYLEATAIARGPAEGPMLQYNPTYDSNLPLVQTRTEPIFNFYDYWLTKLSSDLPSNCRDYGVNFLSNQNPSFDLTNPELPVFEKILDSYTYEYEGQKIHNIRDVELVLPPIETISSEKGLYLPNDRLFGEALIEASRKPASFDFEDLDGDGGVREDEIFKVKWTVDGQTIETDKNGGKFISLVMEDFKDAEFIANIEVFDIYGGINKSRDFKIKVNGCKGLDCCFENETYNPTKVRCEPVCDPASNLYYNEITNQCVFCDSDFSGQIINGECKYTPLPYYTINGSQEYYKETLTISGNSTLSSQRIQEVCQSGDSGGAGTIARLTYSKMAAWYCGPDNVRQEVMIYETGVCNFLTGEFSTEAGKEYDLQINNPSVEINCD